MLKYFYPVIGIYYLIDLYSSPADELYVWDILFLGTLYHGIMWFTFITFIITNLKF